MDTKDRELTLLPPGVQVYLPGESQRKRQFINELFELAHDWDFGELDLPTLDYYDSITRGVSEKLGRRTYQFHDGEGERLALRPDATAQVAKILAGRLDTDELPGRYCYSCRSFRDFELRRGEKREFQQFGAEILSPQKFEADKNLLFFMFELLEKTKIEEFVVDLGNVGVYQGIIEKLDIDPKVKQQLWKLIHRKNESELKKLLAETSLDSRSKEVLAALPTLYGGKEVFERAQNLKEYSSRTAEALDYLYRLYEELEAAGFADRISVDLAVVRELDYYTGIVFEALVPGTGQPVVGGGRYDGLYQAYGVDMPATGLAVEVERLL